MLFVLGSYTAVLSVVRALHLSTDIRWHSNMCFPPPPPLAFTRPCVGVRHLEWEDGRCIHWFLHRQGCRTPWHRLPAAHRHEDGDRIDYVLVPRRRGGGRLGRLGWLNGRLGSCDSCPWPAALSSSLVAQSLSGRYFTCTRYVIKTTPAPARVRGSHIDICRHV